MNARIGIDIGGTFTDLIFLAPDGEIRRQKVPSTPDNYSLGILTGLERVFDSGDLAPGDIAQIMHGTTVATNAILEAHGAKVALITTAGFRDILEIGRLRMPVLYDIRWRKPPPLVPRKLRFEIVERVDSNGQIEQPLQLASAKEAVQRCLAQDVEAIAVCLINAYANGVHERMIHDLIREQDDSIPICLSSEILPEIREFERSSTTVVNAYVLPVVRRYLSGLESKLAAGGLTQPIVVVQSNGGAMSAAAAAERPIHIIESGPAAGVVGAATLSRRLGDLNVLSFDMGGTTAKAALIERGQYLRVPFIEVGSGINIAGRLLRGGGYHVRSPAIDIAEVGAGGGSLVRLDAGQSIRVGPESAGAEPGPACYGLGATLPTVTDANVVLGFINAEALAGGTLRIHRELAKAAIEATIAAPLGLSVEDAAWGVHTLANATMARAVRAVSTERGHDPRAFSLLCFGGNGPVHGATLARLLELKRILIPPVPGLFSALGMLFPQIEHHYVHTLKRRLSDLDPEHFEKEFQKLETQGRKVLSLEGVPASKHQFERLIDLRYVGAASEITVDFKSGGRQEGILARNFHRAHEQLYGYASPDEPIETMNIRVIARSGADRIEPGSLRVRAEGNARKHARSVYFGTEVGWLETAVLSRDDIGQSWRRGPLLIEEFDSTTVVPPGSRVRRIECDLLDLELGR